MGPPSEKTVEKLFEERISGRTPHLDYIVERLSTIDSSRLYKLCTEVKTNRGHTIIHLGNIRGETEAIRQVLDKLSDTERVELLKQRNDWGRTAFHCAAMFNKAETLQCELDMIPQEEKYEILSIEDQKGYSALRRAVEKGNSDVILCLLDSLPSTHHHPELVQILTGLSVGSGINSADPANHDQSLPADESVGTQKIVEQGEEIVKLKETIAEITSRLNWQFDEYNRILGELKERDNIETRETEELKRHDKINTSEIEKLQEQDKSKTSQIEKLKEQDKINTSEIEKLKEQDKSKTSEIEKLKEQDKINTSEIEKLKEQDRSNTSEIEKLKEQDNIKMGRIVKMTEQVTRHDSILAELKIKMEEQDQAIGKVRQNLQSQKYATKELGEIQALLFDRQADINKAQVDETKQLKHCVEDHQFPPSGYLDDQVQDD